MDKLVLKVLAKISKALDELPYEKRQSVISFIQDDLNLSAHKEWESQMKMKEENLRAEFDTAIS